MKRLYTLEINDKTYEAGSQDEVFAIVRSHMKGKMNVSFNISWKNVQTAKVFDGLDEHKDDIVDMLCEGQTYKDVAKKYGMPATTVASFCRHHKLISHKALVYTEVEDCKEKPQPVQSVWFGAKRKG